MNNMMTYLWVAMLLLLPALATAQGKPPRDKLLANKVFIVTLDPQDKKNKEPNIEKDELAFRSGKMGSRHMQQKEGFQPGEYVVHDAQDMDGDFILPFEGINKNADGMSLKWEGTAFGGTIKGRCILSKNGKLKMEYRFEGVLKKK